MTMPPSDYERLEAVRKEMGIDRLTFVRNALMKEVERLERGPIKTMRTIEGTIGGDNRVIPLLPLYERKAALGRRDEVEQPAPAQPPPAEPEISEEMRKQIWDLRYRLNYNAGRIALYLALSLENVLQELAKQDTGLPL